MLTPTEFARTVLPFGTTAIVADLHEVEYTLGFKGVRWAVNEVKNTPLKLYFFAPTYDVAFGSDVGTSRYDIGIDEIKESLSWRQSIGIEVQYPAFASNSVVLMKCIEETVKQRKNVEGLAIEDFQYGEKELQAYVASGVRSDIPHSLEGTLEKARLGLFIEICEGISSSLVNVIPAITKHKIDPRRFMLVSEDKLPYDLDHGHMDYAVRRAIEEGLDPVTAIQLATLNPAEHYHLDQDIGNLAPGRYADIVLVRDLNKFRVEDVIVGGQLVVKNSRYIAKTKPGKRPKWLYRTMNLKRKVRPEDFDITVPKESRMVTARVMKIIDDGTFCPPSEWATASLPAKDGIVQLDGKKDVLRIAAVERYFATGNIGKGFISGLGFKEGAIATSNAHDHHNIVVAGADTKDMAFAANTIAGIGGGATVVHHGKCMKTVELPIGGIISEEPEPDLRKALAELDEASYRLGSRLKSPFAALILCTVCAVVPPLAISDKGMIDVNRHELVEPIIAQ